MRFPKSFVTGGGLANARDLIGGDLRLLLALIVLADDEGVAVATQSELVGLTGLGRRFVRERLESLHDRGYIEADTQRGKRSTYALKLAAVAANKLAAMQDNSPETKLAAVAANYAPKLAAVAANSVERPSRVLNTTTGTGHPFEDNARRALTRIRRERHLPLSVEELMRYAYQLGEGDPWEGYKHVNQRTEAKLDGSRNLAAVIRARLEAA